MTTLSLFPFIEVTNFHEGQNLVLLLKKDDDSRPTQDELTAVRNATVRFNPASPTSVRARIATLAAAQFVNHAIRIQITQKATNNILMWERPLQVDATVLATSDQLHLDIRVGPPPPAPPVIPPPPPPTTPPPTEPVNPTDPEPTPGPAPPITEVLTREQVREMINARVMTTSNPLEDVTISLISIATVLKELEEENSELKTLVESLVKSSVEKTLNERPPTHPAVPSFDVRVSHITDLWIRIYDTLPLRDPWMTAPIIQSRPWSYSRRIILHSLFDTIVTRSYLVSNDFGLFINQTRPRLRAQRNNTDVNFDNVKMLFWSQRSHTNEELGHQILMSIFMLHQPTERVQIADNEIHDCDLFASCPLHAVNEAGLVQLRTKLDSILSRPSRSVSECTVALFVESLVAEIRDRNLELE